MNQNPQTLVELLSNAAARWPDHEAVVMQQGGDTWAWSYAELELAARRTAAYLRDQGIAHGDRVVLWGANRPEWVAAFFGVLAAGAIVAPLDLRSPPSLFGRIVEHTQPAHVFCGKEQAAAVGRLTVASTRLEELRERIEACPPLASGEVVVKPDDIAELVFTSGTTGDPKGVMLTHANIVSNVQMVRTRIEPTTRHRTLSILPLSHMFEQTAGLFTPLAGGASIAFVASLRPDVIFGAMQARRITNLCSVPQILQLFRDGIERELRKQAKLARFQRAHALAGRLPIPLRRLLFRPILRRMGGALEFIASGGAFLDPALAEWWEGLGVKIVQGYGMTEASPLVAVHSLRRRDHRSVGRPVPGCQIRIAEDGELMVRGPNITPGYWQNPAATAAAFTDGWYHSGDLGFFDVEGGVHLHGRKKNMIVLANGMNVYPEDVERALLVERGVKDAVVLGAGDGQDVEVHAVLLLEQDAGDPEGIVKRANKQLAPHQQIRRFTRWPDESFPLTPTLKVKRGDVAKRVAELEPAGARS